MMQWFTIALNRCAGEVMSAYNETGGS